MFNVINSEIYTVFRACALTHTHTHTHTHIHTHTHTYTHTHTTTTTITGILLFYFMPRILVSKCFGKWMKEQFNINKKIITITIIITISQ